MLCFVQFISICLFISFTKNSVLAVESSSIFVTLSLPFKDLRNWQEKLIQKKMLAGYNGTEAVMH